MTSPTPAGLICTLSILANKEAQMSIQGIATEELSIT